MLTLIRTSFLEQENARLVTWSADGGWEDWEQGVWVSSCPRRRRQSCRGRVLASWPRWRPSWPRCTAPCSRPASAPAARSGPWTCGGCCSPPSWSEDCEEDEDVFRLTYSHWPLFYALLLTTNVEIVVFITLCVFVDKPVNFESSWFCPEQTQLSHNPFVLI